MITNIIQQQREERDILMKQPYLQRIADKQISEYLSLKLIKLITGPRRAGKSVMALQLLREQNFGYLNFDDDLLLKNFNENAVIQSLNEVYPGHEFLLLDEIQNLPQWELWVNKLHRRGVNLIITGSNAKLLSHEMASSLTGRYIQIPVFPFSLKEVMRYHGLTDLTADFTDPRKTGTFINLFNEYLINGGFPETVINPAISKNYLSSLFDSVLLKDILRRYKIRQTQQLYDLANYLLANYANSYTFNRLKEDMNFNSVATVQKYISYLEEPWLMINLPRYHTKFKVQNNSPRKIFVIDNGFISSRSFELSPNYGRLLENLVFTVLLRRNYRPGLELFYYRTRNNKEIDFLCRKGHKVEQLIQVSYDITGKKTLNRENGALYEAALELDCNDLLLITKETEGETEIKGKKIIIKPAYRWLK